jgi:valyl-tRNA synthetase
VTKLFNASKFVLSQTGPEGPVVRELDLSFLARLQETVERASRAMDDFEYASALDLAERFFWSGFTDTYVEMVKARARSEADAAGRASALAALQLGLKTFLRLFAPFLPYITEEVWSWGFAETERARSIHHAPWPGAGDFQGLTFPADGGALLETAIAFLEGVNRAKSAGGASVGRHVARLHVATSPATADVLARALDDVLAAARVLQHRIERRDGMEAGAFEVTDIEFGAAPEP